MIFYSRIFPEYLRKTKVLLALRLYLMINKGYPEGLRLIVKKCKSKNLAGPLRSNHLRGVAAEDSAQVFQLNFLAVLPDRRHDVERQRQGTASVFE